MIQLDTICMIIIIFITETIINMVPIKIATAFLAVMYYEHYNINIFNNLILKVQSALYVINIFAER